MSTITTIRNLALTVGRHILLTDEHGSPILWLQYQDGYWTLNDDNTGTLVGEDEDLDEIAADWLKATA